MSVEEAIARFTARWTHPALDRRDVEERVALRLVDGPALRVTVLATPPACRLFLQRGPESSFSMYVHDAADVDAALDALVAKAGLA